MAPRITFDILRPESPRLRRRLAGAMGLRERQVLAHRVYSMFDVNILVLDCKDSSDGLRGFALEIAVMIRVEALRWFIE